MKKTNEISTTLRLEDLTIQLYLIESTFGIQGP